MILHGDLIFRPRWLCSDLPKSFLDMLIWRALPKLQTKGRLLELILRNNARKGAFLPALLTIRHTQGACQGCGLEVCTEVCPSQFAALNIPNL